MEMVKLESEEAVFQFLKRYDASATRKISDRVQNLEEYSEKLFEYAENYVIYQEGETAGFFSFYNNDIIEKRAYLTLIAIETRYQGMKLGSCAIDFICEKCRKNQMNRLCLEVDKKNTSACQFYRKKGFQMTGDASVDSFYMEKEV